MAGLSVDDTIAKTVHDQFKIAAHRDIFTLYTLAENRCPNIYRNGSELFFVFADGSGVVLTEEGRVYFSLVDEAVLLARPRTTRVLGAAERQAAGLPGSSVGNATRKP